MTGREGRVVSFCARNEWVYQQFFRPYKGDPILGRPEQRYSWVEETVTEPQEIWRRADRPRNRELLLSRYRLTDGRRILYVITSLVSEQEGRVDLEPWRELILRAEEEDKEWKRLKAGAKLVWPVFEEGTVTGVGTDPVSVLEALEGAMWDFDQYIRVWKSARQSAEASQFSRPADVYKALEAIAILSQRYFEAKKHEQSVGSWENFFREHGIKYAASESQTTETMYGADRRFLSPDGDKVSMKKHLTLGGGDRVNCLQIYLERNDELEVFEIGYCGVHLPYSGQRT